MGRIVSFDDAFQWEGGWDEFPSLDDLHTSSGEQVNAAREAARKLKNAIVRFCASSRIRLLSLEISVIDERETERDHWSFVTHFYAHSRFRFILQPRANGAKTSSPGSAEDSPYARAMECMLAGELVDGVRAEPILFHPSLRDPSLGYVVGGPIHPIGRDETLMTINVDEAQYRERDPIPFRGKPLTEASSEISIQVDNFLRLLIRETQRVAAANTTVRDTVTMMARELSYARLVVFPFLRDARRAAEQQTSLMGAASYGEAVSGVVFFALVSPGLEEQDVPASDEGNAQQADRLARFLTRLCYALSLRDQSVAARHIANQGKVVEDAAHDIANIVQDLQVETFLGNLFESGKPSREGLLIRPRYTPERRRLSVDELEQKFVRFYARYLKIYPRVTTQLRMLEVANGPAIIREKHQAPADYGLAEVIASASSKVAGLAVAKYELELHQRYKLKGNPDPLPLDHCDIWLPKGYLPADFVEEEFVELFTNAAKYGAPQANGRVPVIVTLSMDERSGGGIAKARISNPMSTRVQHKSRKSSTLRMIPGVHIDPKIKDLSYEVDVTLGPVTVEVKGAPPRLVSPRLDMREKRRKKGAGNGRKSRKT